MLRAMLHDVTSRFSRLGAFALTLISSAALAQPGPVVVIPVPSQGVTEAIANAIMEAVPNGLGQVVEDREVVGVTDPERVGAIIACADNEPCLGEQIRLSGGAFGILVSMGVEASTIALQPRVAGNGSALGEPTVVAEVTLDDATALQGQLSEAFATIATQLPAPPPPPAPTTLLVATNIDGANVSIDGEVIGQTPLPPVEVSAGGHTLSVTRPGFLPYNRALEISEEGLRTNVELEPDPEFASRLAEEDRAAAEQFIVADEESDSILEKWWFWTAVGVVVVGAAIGIGVAASGGESTPEGFEVPSIPLP